MVKIIFAFWDPVMPKFASPLKLYRDEHNEKVSSNLDKIEIGINSL